MREEVKVRMDQGIETHALAQQVFNKGSKARTQSRGIRATHQSECLKSVFLDAIAHDCKTPLTSINKSLTDLLFDLEPNREERKTNSNHHRRGVRSNRPIGERGVGNSSP